MQRYNQYIFVPHDAMRYASAVYVVVTTVCLLICPQNYGTSLWYFVPTLDFPKISPLQVDCVVNKTHRRQFQVGELNE